MGMKKDIIKVCAKANFLLQISSSSTIVDYGKSCLAGKAMNYNIKVPPRKRSMSSSSSVTHTQDLEGDPYSQIPSYSTITMSCSHLNWNGNFHCSTASGWLDQDSYWPCPCFVERGDSRPTKRYPVPPLL